MTVCPHSQTYGVFFHVVEECIEPFDEDDIKLESNSQSSFDFFLFYFFLKSSTDDMMLLAVGHTQLPHTKTKLFLNPLTVLVMWHTVWKEMIAVFYKKFRSS